ncbi:MAG: M48 family metalloprotease [Armatimonadota bacterium]
MKFNMKWMSVGAAAILLTSVGFARGGAHHQQATFTVEDLQKMVDELKPYLPEDPRFAYPIKCVVVDKKEVNANASFDPVDPKAPKDTKPQAKMTVYTGLLDFMKDIRLVRAVVAHELSHLSKQHLGKGMRPKDLDLIFTRQQEYDADATGAIVLAKAGFKTQDMVDKLLKLGESSASWPGSDKVLGDHADTARRASAVAGNNLVLRSMVSFTDGDAFMDSRKYQAAMDAYDRASKEAPTFYECKYNAAVAALLNYYGQVSDSVIGAWYSPDFGPLLMFPKSAGKAVVIVDSDRQNYAVAMAHVKAAVDASPTMFFSLEVQGLALVLDPDGKSENLREGIKSLNAAMLKASTDSQELRVANNLALGYQRSGDVTNALKVMLDSQRTTTTYNASLAANLGQQVPGDEFKADASKAETVLFTYLTRTSSAARGYEKAKSTYMSLCSKFNLKPRDLKEAPIYLCNVLTLTEKGNVVKILDPLDDVLKTFGKPQNAFRYSDSYEGMKEYIWDGGNFSIITDARKVGDEVFSEVLRITSYTVGSSFDLLPKDRTVNASFKITVGMTVAEFSKVLDIKGGAVTSLVRAGKLEDWTYFAGLNMGVLVKDDKIVGITVAPVQQG